MHKLVHKPFFQLIFTIALGFPGISGAGQFDNSLWLGNNAHTTDGSKHPILNTDRAGNELRRVNDTAAHGIAIDPATNRIYFGNEEGELTARDLSNPAVSIATLNPPLSSTQQSSGSDMAFDGTYLWRTDVGDRDVQKIDPRTGAVVFSFTPDVYLLGIAWDGKHLWMSEFNGFQGGERIIQFTLEGKPTGVEFPAPLGGGHVGGLAFDPTDNTLWIGGIDQVQHVDTTGTLLGSFQLPFANRFIDGLEFQGPDKPYKIINGKVDEHTFQGWQAYREKEINCDLCHGMSGQALAPLNLVERLKTISKEEFVDSVIAGKGLMPPFIANKRAIDNLDKIFAYLKARSDGALGEGKPEKQ
jgi:sugar lactone lactonase YvrE